MNAAQSKRRCQSVGDSLRLKEMKKHFLLFLLTQNKSAQPQLARYAGAISVSSRLGL